MIQENNMTTSLLCNFEYIKNTLLKLGICNMDNVMDLIHDTYLRIKSRDAQPFISYNNRKTANYIITIAKNLAIDQDKKRDLDYVDTVTEEVLFKIPDSSIPFTEHNETWQKIIEHSSKILKPTQYDIFKGLFINEMTQKEISKAENMPSGTIKSYKHRALVILKNDEKFKQLVSNLY
jgi:RNA polymerase sigma factor (sigma-70 family)